MQVKTAIENNTLHVTLRGELDEYSASQARQACDKAIEGNLRVEQIIINLSEVSFMDSTGIGFLIGRYKKANRHQIPLYVESPNASADKVLNLSGIYTIIPRIG